MSKIKDNPDWREMVLMVSPTVRTIFNEEGLAILLFPRYKNKWMIRLFVNEKRKNEIRLDLDELGTAVWKLIDGKRTVKEILFELEEIGKTQPQFEERTVKFLAGLYHHRLVQCPVNS
ncbi:MAG: PqqD family protein [Bacteroidales bacterium]|nr:PqqD family protein [Bacteroidales bacterium]